MNQQNEFIVVGAGLLGLSAARALSGRGRQVVVLDQAGIGSPVSGSKGSCRIFRFGYTDARYVTMVSRVRGMWDELAQQSGLQLLQPAPHLTFGEHLPAVHAAMLAAGAPCELLPAEEAARRFPGISAGGPVLLETQSCVTAADLTLQALASSLPDIRTGVRVTALADDGRQVRLQTTAGVLLARTVIVCAGPLTSRLLATARVPVPAAATQEQVAYLTPATRQPDAAPAPQLPIFICHGLQSPFGLPVPGSDLYKIGIHQSGPPCDPASQDQGPDPSMTAALVKLAARLLPGHRPEPVSSERCVYDNTPDEDFILDRRGNVVIGSGTSGHGFKFGPLLGEWLANLATGTPDDLPGPQFSLARFTPPSLTAPRPAAPRPAAAASAVAAGT